MDKLTIEKLQIRANHGVFAAEKSLGQNFFLTITISGDFSQSIWQEDLTKSVHYGELAEFITTEFQKTSYDLIETAAYQVAWSVLNYAEIIKEITITVEKPEAPIALPLATVSFTTTLTKNLVYIGLGSNIGDSAEYLANAREKIAQLPVTKLVNASQTITTPPFGPVVQDDFLNQVIIIETALKPEQLLLKLQQIEIELGRERIVKWGPRTIDLDILYFGNQEINTETLIVPHPFIEKRLFVLQSLIELSPNFIHPRLKLTHQELYDNLIDKE